MSVFQLLDLLPPFLDVKYRGRIYRNLSPALVKIASKIWLCYVGGGRTLVFYERIEDEEELLRYVQNVAEVLNGVTVYETKKLFKS